MKSNFEIRLIESTDAAGVLDIYNYYVEHTIISFEYEAPTLEEFSERIKSTIEEFPWLVCLQNKKIIGYAYAHKHRFRSAYQWSPESTIYLEKDFHTKGIGRILYQTLFNILKYQGYFNVYAGVGLPNEKSVGFHKAMSFEEIGVFKKIGYKHGNWHDTHWFQLQLSEHIVEPKLPKTIQQILEDEALNLILLNANAQLKNIYLQNKNHDT